MSSLFAEITDYCLPVNPKSVRYKPQAVLALNIGRYGTNVRKYLI